MAKAGEKSIQERTGCEDMPLAPEGLGKRTADEATVIRWVANNVDNHDVKPEDCPAPFAWTLLRECRQVPGFMFFFLEKCWSKLIPPRSQLEATGPKEQDGAPLIELADRILKHSQAAQDPAPKAEPRPSAFEAFHPKKEVES